MADEDRCEQVTEQVVNEEAINHMTLVKPQQLNESLQDGEQEQTQTYRLVYNADTQSLALSGPTPLLVLTSSLLDVQGDEECTEVIGDDNSNVELHSTKVTQFSTLNDQEEHDAAIGNKTSYFTNHERLAGSYVCEVPDCGRYFSTRGYLRNHQGAIHGKKQSLRCEYENCGRTFTWSAHLKYHRMTHRGERLYQCMEPGCDKSFYTSQRLKVHMRTHTGERPFKCITPGCDKSFTTAGNLKNHTRIHSGEKPFACSHQGCGQTFAEHSSLKKHMTTHSGEKQYECDVCQKRFTQLGSRNVHMRRHQGVVSLVNTKEIVSLVNTKEHTSSLDLVISMDKWGSTVPRHGEDDIIPYNGATGTHSIVYSSAIADHIVTVKTEPQSSENIVIAQATVVSEDSQNLEDFQDQVLSDGIIGNNVVVLSQPDMTPRTYDEDQHTLTEEHDSLIQ